jgi:P27 family predicted phage terminase small subunit
MQGRYPKQTPTPAKPGSTPANLTRKPPGYLAGHAAKIWRETISDLEAEGIPLHRLNRQALVGFCDACGIVRECSETLAREGHTMAGGREGIKRNPAASIRISALQAVRAYAAELGLSPASSGRLPKAPIKKWSKFDDL